MKYIIAFEVDAPSLKVAQEEAAGAMGFIDAGDVVSVGRVEIHEATEQDYKRLEMYQ